MKLSNLTFIVTDACNFNCAYCVQKKENNTISHTCIDTAVDFFYPFLEQAEQVYIGFYGGEPLLAYDKITYAVESVREKNETGNKNITFSVTTNGVLLTDKMLDNYKFVGVIHLIFPGAKIIDMQRNPIDVCYSCYKQCFNHQSVPYTYSLENLASRYRDYRRVMRHWGRVLPGRIHTVEYEQLVDRQEQVTRNLLQHCGLDWDDACLEFHSAPRTVQTNSNIQVRQPLYADSIARWKTRERYLGPLLELTND